MTSPDAIAHSVAGRPPSDQRQGRTGSAGERSRVAGRPAAAGRVCWRGAAERVAGRQGTGPVARTTRCGLSEGMPPDGGSVGGSSSLAAVVDKPTHELQPVKPTGITVAIFLYLGFESLFLGGLSPASIMLGLCLGLLLYSSEDEGPATDLRSTFHVR